MGGVGSLNELQNAPQVQQLRELISQNPALLQPLIQQLAASNPQIAQLIQENPEALLQLLGAGGDGDEDGALPPGSQVVQVTPEERAAIERVSPLLNVLGSSNIALAGGIGIPSSGCIRSILCLR